MRLLAGEAWNNSWDLVFTNELGGHLSHFTVYIHFKRIVKELGMPEERFHDLRHSFAVASIESGDDIKTVQSNLGHATASFTLDVYGHVSQKMRQQSADRMEEFIQKVSGWNDCRKCSLKSIKGQNKGQRAWQNPVTVEITGFCVAEKEGFEPSRPFRSLHDFQSCALDQLGDFSIAVSSAFPLCTCCLEQTAILL